MNAISRAITDSDKVAFHLIGGDALSYRALEDLSCRTGHAFHALGLRHGDHVAMMIENRAALIALVWAAQRSGLYYTLIPTHLMPDEAAYMASDSSAQLIATSDRFIDLWRSVRAGLGTVRHWLTVDAPQDGFAAWRDVIADYPATPAPDALEGSAMLYSSGTTGRPKGIKKAIGTVRFGEEPLAAIYRERHVMDEHTVYLSPAPLYHAAPLRAVLAVNRLGGSVIALAKFEAEPLLAAIDRYRVTHVQLVPTMLRRLLDLPDAVRAQYNVSSLRRVIHAAAPCPIDLKQAAIDWFGPIVTEYYGGTEGIGATYIDSEEWLTHPGSVGRAIMGELHIVGEDGAELPVGAVGDVYFGNGPRFAYHNAPEKLEAATHPEGWVTLGDIGRVDEEGYLYLVDRKSFVINSGGVNIYPAEAEEALRSHPAVADVAVIGVPNRDFGEEVKAVIELRAGVLASEALRDDLIAHCRARISAVKCPRSVDFIDIMPRSDAGKLLKGVLRQDYWGRDTA
ncbi:MAG: AMP-binding protein [Sphingomonas sp.]|nr:AMP-binding protein [Sphingomonas sp.]MBX9858117.1 AMP-binding protein [Sphingomonas sp.]